MIRIMAIGTQACMQLADQSSNLCSNNTNHTNSHNTMNISR